MGKLLRRLGTLAIVAITSGCQADSSKSITEPVSVSRNAEVVRHGAVHMNYDEALPSTAMSALTSSL